MSDQLLWHGIHCSSEAWLSPIVKKLLKYSYRAYINTVIEHYVYFKVHENKKLFTYTSMYKTDQEKYSYHLLKAASVFVLSILFSARAVTSDSATNEDSDEQLGSP